MKYRKKPVVIEALQLLWTNWNEMCDFAKVGSGPDDPQGCYVNDVGNVLPDGETSDRVGLIIPTLEGVMLATQGDWIIRGVKGELCPCKPDIFDMTYEAVLDGE